MDSPGLGRGANDVATMTNVTQTTAAKIIQHRRAQLSKDSVLGSFIGRVKSGQVENREQENPHQIDKVPKETCHLDPVGEPVRIGFPHPAAGSPEIGKDN